MLNFKEGLMGYTERYENRQKKQRKKEKKEQLDFFLLEKGRVLLKWRLSVGCDVYQMGWSKWGYSGSDKDREIEWRFVWLRTISFYHLFPFYFVSVCPNLNCEIACHSSLPWIFSFTFESDYPVIYFTIRSSCYLYSYYPPYQNCDWYTLPM